MGEVLMSSDEVKTESEIDRENGEFEGNKRRKKMSGGSFVSVEAVNWESFLPTMALRVLLVEADDSTRQIVTALLRKCNYRVSAVSDGLQAWEMLKAKPHNIDLILTEVDLPSISGFALLTLIMEHKICKSIPVIMMSSQHSISTVYKCMLRGAADYLVKPLRRNELRNLWQHLIASGNTPQDESVGQKKIEAISDNNAASNRSSGCLVGGERNKEQTEKGSEAQSTCTKPDVEAEDANMENMQEFLLLPSNSQKHEVQMDFNQRLLVHEKETGVDGACKDTKISVEAGDAVGDSPRKAIDFMGTFDRNCNSSSMNSTSKVGSSTHLDFSLGRCSPNAFENHATREKPTLWHPNSSAFTRYSSRPSQPLQSTLTSVSDQKKESGTDSEKMLPNSIDEYNSDTPSPKLTPQRNTNPLTTGSTGQLRQTEVAASCTQQVVLPVLVPSPSLANQKELACCVNPFHHPSFESNSSGQFYDRLASNTNQLTNQPLQKLDQKMNSTEDRGHISPTTDQSATSSFCNGSLSQLNGIAYGSTAASNNSNIDQEAVVRASADSKNDDVFPSPTGNSHRSIQREAALTKFRLKRKDRCFEKKVRYESRKKLAEQRPRVKGQFVRQPQADLSHYGNSSDE
ncbi:two-component response regulator-like APRR5 isoform X2 [Gossypium raimondii]|uniref:two-component response regulator-like APRR5 isoform X2 n=1 Tax=Gossypium raimondii TaxID=29730 RepID=UPI00227C0ADF|nr:two-component response regulator-like APRR5 isoform X2 [Gossypium raimondii]